MNEIELNNKNLWKWLKSFNQSKTVLNYLKIIQKHQLRKDYLVILKKGNRYMFSQDNIINKLSLQVPREYFQELLFCAKTFALIMGTVFPPLLPSIDQMLYVEWLLYMEPSYQKYRDHLVHIFKVAYVGDQLISDSKFRKKIVKLQFSSDNLKKWCEENNINLTSFKEKDKEEIVRVAFFLAAIFHDFGYGYFYQNLYRERLFKLYSWLPPESDFTTVKGEFYQKLETSLPCRFIRESRKDYIKKDKLNKEQNQIKTSGFFRDCLPLNHSIASTFSILSIAEKFKNAGALDDMLYVAFQIAAEAIMIHDMTANKNWLYLECKKGDHFLDCNSHKCIPLSLLLIFADELSIWNRYKIKPIKSRRNDEISFKMDKKDVPCKIKITIEKNGIIIATDNKKELEAILKNNFNFFKVPKTAEYPTFWNYQIEVNEII